MSRILTSNPAMTPVSSAVSPGLSGPEKWMRKVWGSVLAGISAATIAHCDGAAHCYGAGDERVGRPTRRPTVPISESRRPLLLRRVKLDRKLYFVAHHGRGKLRRDAERCPADRRGRGEARMRFLVH